MLYNNRALGTAKERQAEIYLQRKGYRILERNFRCRFGEIDLIASDGKTIVFTEVKYRNSAECGYAEDAVSVKKQQVITRCALYYLARHGSLDTPCRFDVIAINGGKLRHIENAYDAQFPNTTTGY